MSDTTDNATIKLVDFGLSKFVGPNGTSSETYGTIGYVAPEVLKKENYGFSCDMWGLGCIVYSLMCGCLPFDDENQKETIRQTINEPLLFDSSCWSQVSKSAKDFITCLLKKDPTQRMTMKELFEHPWMQEVKC